MEEKSFFSPLVMEKEDPVYGIKLLYERDLRKHKIDLSVGVAKDEELNPLLFLSTKEAEKILLEEEENKDYLLGTGLQSFLVRGGSLVFGEDLYSHLEAGCATTQTIGGTGALRLLGELLKRLGKHEIFLSNKTWGNHLGIFHDCGFTAPSYPYYDPETHDLLFNQMMGMLTTVKEGSVVLIQACGHNPTGADLTLDQWAEVASVIKERKLFPVIDAAYLGLGKGWERDTQPIRALAKKGIEMAVSVTYSKTFGLYGERVGQLFVITKDPAKKKVVDSVLRHTIRLLYSSPPRRGAYIVDTVLKHHHLKKMWEDELMDVRSHIRKMRLHLSNALGKGYEYIEEGVGMFSLLGLTEEHVETLRNKHAIFMPKSSRINLGALNEDVILELAAAIKQVVT